jgi:hypothetical protein
MTGTPRLQVFNARNAFTAMLAACLAACASVPSAPPPPQRPRPAQPSRPVAKPPAPTRPAAPATGFIKPKIMKAPGLEDVIGQDTSGLSRLFGAPSLDVREGDARKLQFRGKPCVLDVYLYPYAQGQQPRAAYVDARRASDGRDVNRGSCVAALRR